MASNTGDLSDADVALDLNNIRKSLMRMEDSIIFSLIERAQYKINAAVYQPDCAWERPDRAVAPLTVRVAVVRRRAAGRVQAAPAKVRWVKRLPR